MPLSSKSSSAFLFLHVHRSSIAAPLDDDDDAPIGGATGDDENAKELDCRRWPITVNSLRGPVLFLDLPRDVLRNPLVSLCHPPFPLRVTPAHHCLDSLPTFL